MIEKIRNILKAGECINVEFKECKRELPKNVYETVCAFLNRIGGELLLGVKDNGTVVGIDPEYIGKIRNDFVTSLNNINKFSPTVYLTIDEVEIDGKKILYIYIPESSQVHRCSGKIYDRNEDGDFNITDNTTLVANLYLRKQTGFTENTVYPFVTMAEFRQDLISYARKIATVARQDHPWADMSDEELIKSAGLFKKDWQTGKEGFTLAAILLLAKDDVILSAVPHHRTDAVLRKIDTDRYDDRDLVRTNLIESYKRLVAFAEKHLPDPFYLEGDQRISIRSMVMREVIANSLIHREYMNHFPAKFIIERDRLYIENSNKPHGYGVISIQDSRPFPKNPAISAFFREIKFCEELGSGFRKVARYGKAFFGIDPVIEEKDIFKFEAKYGKDLYSLMNVDKGLVEKENGLVEKSRFQDSTKPVEGLVENSNNGLVEKINGLAENQKIILRILKETPKTTKYELAKILEISTTAVDKNIDSLRKKGLLKRVGPDKGGYWKVKS